MYRPKAYSPPMIPYKESSLKLVNTRKVSGKINVTIRLVKSSPSSPILSSAVLCTPSSLKLSEIQLFKPSSTVNPYKIQDPSDFIEPIPLTNNFIPHSPAPEEIELCETVPILPKSYSIRPSVALRNTLKRRSLKHRFKSPTIQVKSISKILN